MALRSLKLPMISWPSDWTSDHSSWHLNLSSWLSDPLASYQTARAEACIPLEGTQTSHPAFQNHLASPTDPSGHTSELTGLRPLWHALSPLGLTLSCLGLALLLVPTSLGLVR